MVLHVTSFFRDVQAISRIEVDEQLSAHEVMMLPVHGSLPLVLQKRGANLMLVDPQGGTWEMVGVASTDLSAATPDFALEGELLTHRFHVREIVRWGRTEMPASQGVDRYLELFGTVRDLLQQLGERIILQMPITRISDKQQIFLQHLATRDWAGVRFLSQSGVWLEHTIERQLLVRVLRSTGSLHWCVYQEGDMPGDMPASSDLAAVAFTTVSDKSLAGMTLEIGYEAAELAPYPLLRRAIVHGSSVVQLPAGQQLFWRPEANVLIPRPSRLDVESFEL